MHRRAVSAGTNIPCVCNKYSYVRHDERAQMWYCSEVAWRACAIVGRFSSTSPPQQQYLDVTQDKIEARSDSPLFISSSTWQNGRKTGSTYDIDTSQAGPCQIKGFKLSNRHKQPAHNHQIQNTTLLGILMSRVRNQSRRTLFQYERRTHTEPLPSSHLYDGNKIFPLKKLHTSPKRKSPVA